MEKSLTFWVNWDLMSKEFNGIVDLVVWTRALSVSHFR